MNKIILLLSFITLTIPTFGQIEKANYKLAADNFEKDFNLSNYDEIFSCFSLEMQNALSLDKTRAFMNGLKQQAGKILEKEFIKYEQSYACYKTKFEKALFSVNISVDEHSKINGLFIRPYTEQNLAKQERNKTKMILPFTDEWTVVWGGDTRELNYHVEHNAQKNAIDVVVSNEYGKSFKTDGKTNEDYYAYGKKLIAPCDGEVVLVIDGIKDNMPGSLNPLNVTGNTVVIKTVHDEYLFLAHFKQHSIVVKQGQQVKQAQLLGLCGNSGNSSEPHLHFHIQNVEDMGVASGVKCFFDKIRVNGGVRIDYSPQKGEKIGNVE